MKKEYLRFALTNGDIDISEVVAAISGNEVCAKGFEFWTKTHENGLLLLFSRVAMPNEVERCIFESYVSKFGDVVMKIFIGNHEGGLLLAPSIIVEFCELRREKGDESGQD